MRDAPSDEQIGLAQYVGQRFARGAPPWVDPDDLAQDAVVALLALWPKLTARYPNGVPNGAIYPAVKYALIDTLRASTGHRHVVQAKVVTIDDDDRPLHLAADTDVEDDVMRRLYAHAETAELIEVITRRIYRRIGPETTRARRWARHVCARLAEGASKGDIARDAGVTPASVSHVLAELRTPGRDVLVAEYLSRIDRARRRKTSRRRELDRPAPAPVVRTKEAEVFRGHYDSRRWKRLRKSG